MQFQFCVKHWKKVFLKENCIKKIIIFIIVMGSSKNLQKHYLMSNYVRL